MSQRSPKLKTLLRRARKSSKRANELSRIARILGRDVEMAQVLVIALLTQADGEIAISKGTIDRVARGDVPHEFEVVDGADGERVLKFKKAEAVAEPVVVERPTKEYALNTTGLSEEQIEAAHAAASAETESLLPVGTELAKESPDNGIIETTATE